MREVVLQMHITLDGLADSREGFVPISDRDYWKALNAALKGTAASEVDGLLLGRGTYRQFLGFWPRAASDPSTPPDWRRQAKFLNDTPKFVFSRTLRSVEWANSTLVKGDLKKEVARLKQRPGKNLLVPGGVAFPRALIEQDLVDEYLLSVVPIIQGAGRDRLFGPLHRRHHLNLVRTWRFHNGVVLHQYRRARRAWKFRPPDIFGA